MADSKGKFVQLPAGRQMPELTLSPVLGIKQKSAVLFTVLTACTPTHSFRDYTDFVTGFAACIWAICINHWKKKDMKK